jgi:hypothetical protein
LPIEFGISPKKFDPRKIQSILRTQGCRLNWVIPQKNLLRKDAIALGNYLIEIWEENQRDRSYLRDQWLVSWAIGKYLREIHHANAPQQRKRCQGRQIYQGLR